jgi:hypothetical protein
MRMANHSRLSVPASLVGCLCAGAHIALCIELVVHPDEGGWQWFPAFLIDFPASFVPLFLTRLGAPPFGAFAVVGSLGGFYLGIGRPGS